MEAYEAIKATVPERADAFPPKIDESGVRFIVDHKTLDRLTGLRGPGESYNEAAAQRQPSWRNRLALFGCRVAL
jgi:hypothetical protein